MNFLYDINDLDSKVIYVYGAGGLGQNLVEKLSGHSFDIRIIDDNPFLKEINGIEVRKYDEIALPVDCNIVVASRFLSKFKSKKKTYYHFLDANQREIIIPNYSQLKKIDFVKKNLSGYSLDLYGAVIKTRIHGSLKQRFSQLHNFLKINGYGSQYMDFLPKDKKSGYVIDAGYYDGQTTSEYFNNLKEYKKIIGFDPSPISQINIPRFDMVKSALSDRVGEIYFYVDDKTPTASSLILRNDARRVKVQATTIDDYFGGTIPPQSIIKTDLEGGDFNAIKGAINTIVKCRPFLAVSIYHSTDDLYEIPVYLMSILENYSWEVRHYSYGYNETVLYGIPL